MLNKLNSILPRHLLFNIYFAYVHYNLVYLKTLWLTASFFGLNVLQILQNNRQPILTPSASVYSDKLLSLSKLLEFEIPVIFQKKILTKVKTNIVFMTNNEIYNHFTRNNNTLVLSVHRVTLAWREMDL